VNKAARIAKWIAACAAIVALIIVLWSAIWWAIQPRHAGKTIHWWFSQARIHLGASKENHDIQLAFRAMGSNAVPFLIERLQTPDVWSGLDLKEDLKRTLLRRDWVPNRIKKILVQPTGASGPIVAFELLKSMGSGAISAQPLLEEMLSRPDLQQHYEPFHLLRSFGLEASNSAPVIARLFSHTNRHIRSYALSTFAAITPPGSPNTKLLLEAVRQGHIRAAEGLPILFFPFQLDLTELLPKLGDELCMTGHFHSDALATCRKLRLQAKVLVPRFAEAMQDPDPGYRAELLKELRKDLIPNAPSALDTVIASLNDPDATVRSEAARTLVALNPGAEKLRGVLSVIRARKLERHEYLIQTIESALQPPESPIALP
jgi:hypothetical protein